MSALSSPPVPSVPFLLPDIGSESKGQALRANTRGLNDFLTMAKDLREQDGGGNEQDAGPALGSGEGEPRNRSVQTEGGGAELWRLKSFLFSLWIPDIGHSGGVANECARDCLPKLSGTVTLHHALVPSRGRWETNPANTSTPGRGASQTPGSV